MPVIDQFTFADPVSALSLEPGGERVAVVIGEREVHVYRLADGRLELETSASLSVNRYLRSPQDQIRLDNTKVVFADAQTLLTTRHVMCLPTDPKQSHQEGQELVSLTLRTGEEQGYGYRPGMNETRSDLALMPPKYVLLGQIKDVVCLDTATFQEVCRAREIDAQGDVCEKDAGPEEQIAPNGFVYDASRNLLHMVCGVFNEALLVSYRFDASRLAFDRVSHRSVVEGHEPAGICLNPTGEGVTVSFQIMDDLIDLRGEPVDWQRDQKAMLAVAKERGPSLPQKVRLGRLGIFSIGAEQWIDLYSELERDFAYDVRYTNIRGKEVPFALRVTGGHTLNYGEYLTQPVYIDDRHVVVGTPSGFLQRVDTVSGQTEVVHDFHSAINSLKFSAEKNLLLAGCENGILTALSVSP